jgi:uncharacterized protein YndB with AHSA1/START domain
MMPIAPHEQLRAVVRGLTTVEHDGELVRLLTAERTYPAGVDEVWDALTSPERVPRWLTPVSGDLRQGGRFQLEGNAGGDVLSCAPPHRLSITWEYAGQMSWVDVELTAVEGGTRLLLEHTAPVDPDTWEKFGPGAVGIGWEMALMGLHEHLRTPDADPAEMAAWMVGPEGRAYLVALMTGCSGEWTEMSIAFGTDPVIARTAGERCAAAYTASPEG